MCTVQNKENEPWDFMKWDNCNKLPRDGKFGAHFDSWSSDALSSIDLYRPSQFDVNTGAKTVTRRNAGKLKSNSFGRHSDCGMRYDGNGFDGLYDDYYQNGGVSVATDKSNGRPSMKHPTIVAGEITKPWTPVFALLEHKYVDKKPTEIGKPKRRGVLVPAGQTYGRANEKRDGGSSEALHGWPTLSNTTLPFNKKEKSASRDFMALNRAAVSAGLTTANAQYEFRATHDVRRKTQSEDGNRMRTRRMPPSMVYGISTRPSTPIFDLLEHKYQDKWLQERRKLELAKRQEEQMLIQALQDE